MKTLYIFFSSIFIFSSLVIEAQSNYDYLPIEAKIRVKQGISPYFSQNRITAGGTTPIVLASPEQDCNSAIPVCQNVYNTNAAYSGEGAVNDIPSNSSCLGSNEKNSVWYTFNTSSAGNLAFQITPNNASNDYDFALYDITNTNCSGISSGATAPVRCNFSASSGATGLSASGSAPSVDASGSNQSSVLATTSGKTYVLVISNYSSSQSGYSLDFSSGTASIFDVTPPNIVSATAACGSNSILFTASEQIKCNSIAANGSDFTITGTGGPYTVSSAIGLNCGVNTAQVNLTIAPALSGAGPWTVGVQAGSDGNSLIDACGNAMAAQTQTFSTTPMAAMITGPSSVCKGSPIALTGSYGSGYLWTGLSVPVAQNNLQTISFAANTPGDHVFNLQITNGTCPTSNATHTVTVKDGPTAAFNAIPGYTVCVGTPVTFTNTSLMPCTIGLPFGTYGLGTTLCECGSGGLCYPTRQTAVTIGYTWSYGDATSHYATGAGVISPTHIYTAPGIYNVNLTTSTLFGVGGCPNSTNRTITVLPAAGSLTVSPSVTICPGQTATLTASGGASYTWSPSASVASPNSGTTTAIPATTTEYTLSSPGCASTQTAAVNVTVNNLPPAIGAINGATVVCANSIGMVYSVANVAATNYTWAIPASATITSVNTNSNSITVDFGATAGTVSVTASSACGTATTSLNVTMSNSLTISVTPNPVTLCGVGSVSLSALGASNYTWSPSASLSSANGSTVSANPNSTTTYTVDGASGSCVGSTTVTVSVINSPTIVINASTYTVCPSGSTSLTATGATSYTWLPSPNLSPISGASVVAFPIANETYTVIGGAGTCTSSAQAVISVTNNPTVVVANSPTICSGGIGSLNASGADSYTWSPSINLSATTGANVNASPNSNQVYLVTGATTLGCKNTATVAVTVVSTPTVTLLASSYSICTGNTTTLTAFGATDYAWASPATLTTITGSITTANPNVTTTYTVIGSNGVAPNICNTTKTIEIVVLPNTVALAGPSASICLGANTIITASGGNTYSWSPSSTVSSPNSSITVVTPTATTIYTITASNNGLCAGTATLEVLVHPLPQVNAGPDTTVNIDEYITLYGSGNVTVGFLSPNGVPLLCNFCPIVSVNPQETTCYTLQGENLYGCVATDDVCVTVTKDWNIYIPNAFTPNEDNTNDVFIPVGYGIEEIKLAVFDRWGVQIFKSDAEHTGWDGKCKGKVCPQDVYVYKAQIITMSGKKINKTGHVTLLPLIK